MPDYTDATLQFGENFDERAALEAELKGWFDLAELRLPDGRRIPLAFRDPVRLAQDLESEVLAGGSCIAELVLIVVPKVNVAFMQRAAKQLLEEGFVGKSLALASRNGAEAAD